MQNKTSKLMGLESRHDGLRAELKTLKVTLTERDVEVKTLN
jgi:hypothetical protein